MDPNSILFGRDFFEAKPKETALIVVDMQNAFLEEGAPYEVSLGREIIPKLGELIDFCRAHKIPIIWTRSDHSYPYGGLMLKKFPPIRDKQVLWKGTHGADFYPKMTQPRDGEYQVVKHKYDAFYQTDLDLLLRNLGAKTIIITGVDTSVCCESTARSAFFRDYQVLFASDGNASFSPEAHQATLNVLHFLFGRVATVDEIMAELKEGL